MTNGNALLSTGLHLVELIVVIAIVWGLSKMGWVTGEQAQVVVGLVLMALANFVRKSESTPVPDYTSVAPSDK